MYAVIKEVNGKKEIMWIGKDEDMARTKLVDYVASTISNADEYTSSDWDAIKDQGYENYGMGRVYICFNLKAEFSIEDIAEYDEDIAREVFGELAVYLNDRNNIDSQTDEKLSLSYEIGGVEEDDKLN